MVTRLNSNKPDRQQATSNSILPRVPQIGHWRLCWSEWSHTQLCYHISNLAPFMVELMLAFSSHFMLELRGSTGNDNVTICFRLDIHHVFKRNYNMLFYQKLLVIYAYYDAGELKVEMNAG